MIDTDDLIERRKIRPVTLEEVQQLLLSTSCMRDAQMFPLGVS